MKIVYQILTFACAVFVALPCLASDDWPQWRGTDRSARASFNPPHTWPKELTQKWKVEVGEGVSTPAVVGDKLYAFSREEGNEVLRCLDAATGKELWQDKYESLGASGPASGYSGPRCSPTVANGKVVTLGVRGMLSCLDAATGKKLWRIETDGAPRFFTSSSPIVVDGLCVVQIGGEREGGTAAYDLNTGQEKWKWTQAGTAYASPDLLNVDGLKAVVVETDSSIAALNLADGKLLWQTPFAVRGRGYNASSPIVDGQTLIFSGSGRGTKALKFEKSGDALEAKELWNNEEQSVQFNTPVLKDGYLYGLTQGNEFFCVDAKTGKTAWTAPAGESGDGGGGRRRGGGGGYGSIVNAGNVLVALTPSSELIVFEPGAEKYNELARIKVASSPTHAYPVLLGNRIYIKDRNSLILYTVES